MRGVTVSVLLLVLIVVTISTFTLNVRPVTSVGYSATIWAFAENEGWMDWVPITMDGSSTGKTTPYIFTDLTGTHTFTVPLTEPMGRVFYEWSTGSTDTTITVDSEGTYTAHYKVPVKVTIRADGSIDPVAAPVTTVDKITYVLIDSLVGSVVVERSNIVLDGAGYTLIGSGIENGTTLTGSTSNVVVRNMVIENCYIGIVLKPSSFGNTLSDNNLRKNKCGVALEHLCANNLLSGNNVTANNAYGVFLDSSSSNTLSGNNIAANSWAGIRLDSSANNVLSENNVANGEVGILLGSSCSYNNLSDNKVTESSIGIGLASACNNNFLSSNNAADNGYGFWLHNCSYNLLDGNIVTANIRYGFWLNDSSYNVLSGNLVMESGEYGIVLDSSSFNALSGNNIMASNYGGILLNCSSLNVLSDNSVTANGGNGIMLAGSIPLTGDCAENFLSGNNITGNENGIGLSWTSYNTFSGNIIRENKEYGFWIDWASANTLSGNKVTDNEWGISLYHCDANVFYHNSFINNTNQVYITSGSANGWDDGYPSGGNYWSDRNHPDADLDKIQDLPYIMDENNTDRYPLVYSYECYEPGYVCSPDLNEDGIVNMIDVTRVTVAFTSTPGILNWNPVADIDLNEIINIVDVTMVAKDFGRTV